MRQIPLKLEKSDILLVADFVRPVDGNAVFCYHEGKSICGIGSILLRNILSLFGPSYGIIGVDDIDIADSGDIMYGFFTNLPYSDYLKETGRDEEDVDNGGQILTQYMKEDGKMYVRITNDGIEHEVEVGLLVAADEVPNPDPDRLKYVRHKDGNLQNNKIENLEWSETKE